MTAAQDAPRRPTSSSGPHHGAGAPSPSRPLSGALVVGAVIIIISSLVRGSLDLMLPLQAYGNLFEGAFGSVRGILFSIVSATPLILGGMAVGLGFKAGLFNIGAQGQFLMGALGSAAVGALRRRRIRRSSPSRLQSWRVRCSAPRGDSFPAPSRHGPAPTRSSPRSC